MLCFANSTIKITLESENIKQRTENKLQNGREREKYQKKGNIKCKGSLLLYQHRK